MEKKLPKKSINTMIYLLLAAMLFCMVFVSIYTVAAKKARENKTNDPETEMTDDKAETTEKRVVRNEKDSETRKNEDEVSASVEADSEDTEVGVLLANENDEEPLSAAEHYFVLPVNGFISKGFEIDVPVWSATMNDYRAHSGTDIAAAVGSEVIASSSGRVCKVWSDPMMGKAVTIDHGDDIYTTYMNLGDEVIVSVGEKVGMGQVIGCVGTSSLIEVAEEPHLHFELKLGGEYADPLEYVSAETYSIGDE